MRIQIKHTVLLLAALVAFPCGALTAQEIRTPDAGAVSAKGAVTDAAGEPLYQVEITDPAGKILGTTDLYGRFELRTDVPNLCFRTAGYGNVSLPVSPDMKVTMRTDASSKDDLLDYGYGVVRRRGTLSEAVSAIRGRQLEDVPNASLSQLLEGQILGLERSNTLRTRAMRAYTNMSAESPRPRARSRCSSWTASSCRIITSNT